MSWLRSSLVQLVTNMAEVYRIGNNQLVRVHKAVAAYQCQIIHIATWQSCDLYSCEIHTSIGTIATLHARQGHCCASVALLLSGCSAGQGKGSKTGSHLNFSCCIVLANPQGLAARKG